jgi:acetyl/propionyl-CoA carboxylase alpha subunit
VRWAGGAALALAAWALAMLALPFVGPSGRQVAVVGDRAAALRMIVAAGGQVVEARGGAVVARSDRPGFVRRLYRAGAPLVLEARIDAGCFSRTE